MSSTRGSAGGGGRNAVNGKGNNGGAVGSIPQASKKMVQSLKEIVNCPELEIYAMLKECNMDPNEAVNRLLSQDPFHEVKSKKEKKKEYKDATDSRSRGGSSTLNRGARGGNDRYGRAILSQFSSSESGTARAKPSYKKDSGAPYTGSSSMPAMSGSNVNCPLTSVSEVTMESKPLAVGASEVIPTFTPPSGFQSVWPGVPGQLSMADIVKMGRPHGRASSNVNPSEQMVNHQHAIASQIVPTHGLRISENYAAKVSEFNSKPGVAGSQHLQPNDGWPHVEQIQTVSMTSKSEPPVVSMYEETFTMPFERTNHHLDNVQCEENAEIGDHVSLLSSRKTQEESSANPSVFNDNYHNVNSYQVQGPAFEQQEVEDASISTINIQQLSLSKEEEEQDEEEQDEEEEVEEEDFPKEADSPAVKIPEHLQVQSIDCSHLSFGSFASAVNAPFSQTFASGPEKSNIEETSVTAEAASAGHTDTRNAEYYDDEHLRTVSDGDISQRLAASTGGYDMPSVSQSETLKQEAVEVAPGNQYSFPPSNTFENSQQLNPSFSHSQTSSQMQNLPPFSGVMAYSDSLPSSLLLSNVQPVRDAELPYSPFPTAQSMPGKYTGSMPGPTNSMTEGMKTANMPSPLPEQNLPGSSIAGAPGFPHLAMHPYSQPSLPFANMIGYPFLPQSYTYMPSAFQQAIAAAGNSTYHQSLAAAAAHPQYKNSVSGSNLPQSAAVPSGYGAFGSSTSVPGNFPLNPSQPPAAPSATSMSYEELLNSQYKDAAHLLALQQGLGSRTMSAVPASAYYSLQGQTQQPAGYRQTQQLPSQHYSNVGGYPNFYHSQAGLSLEAQQQMSRDQSLGGSQGQQQPKQPQQMWPNGY